MTLREFKIWIESFPVGTIFCHSISDPFSWRGSYDEVAFTVNLDTEMSREDMLGKIHKAYNDVFIGYKGGEFEYDGDTYIHFEESIGAWSDGQYVSEKIAEIECNGIYEDNETRLVKKAWNYKNILTNG